MKVYINGEFLLSCRAQDVESVVDDLSCEWDIADEHHSGGNVYLLADSQE